MGGGRKNLRPGRDRHAIEPQGRRCEKNATDVVFFRNDQPVPDLRTDQPVPDLRAANLFPIYAPPTCSSRPNQHAVRVVGASIGTGTGWLIGFSAHSQTSVGCAVHATAHATFAFVLTEIQDLWSRKWSNGIVGSVDVLVLCVPSSGISRTSGIRRRSSRQKWRNSKRRLYDEGEFFLL